MRDVPQHREAARQFNETPGTNTGLIIMRPPIVTATGFIISLKPTGEAPVFGA